MTYLILKYLRVLGAIVILGTGAGIVFFTLMPTAAAMRHSSPAPLAS
jgi:uncharacterized membrane protein